MFWHSCDTKITEELLNSAPEWRGVIDQQGANLKVLLTPAIHWINLECPLPGPAILSM